MTYAEERIIHDADSHVMETLNWLDGFVDPAYSQAAKPLLEHAPDTVARLLAAARRLRDDEDAYAAATAQPIAGPKGWSAFGAFDGRERAMALDRLGFASQLVFPTIGLRAVHAAPNEDLRYALARAYNRAIAAFCADPRLIPVAYVPLDDPAQAVAEARRAIDDGCGAILLYSGPAGDRSPGHSDFDPFWRCLSDRRVPFMLHIGSGTQTQPQAYHNNGRPRSPDLHGGGENLRFCDYTMLWYAPQVFLTALVYDGVFERFPELHGGVIESAAGWVPEFLRQLDLGYEAFSRTDPYLKQLSLRPSEYLRRAVKFTPFAREDVGRMIRDAGPELFLFSSDYPHPEGTTDPIGRFQRSLMGIGEDAQEKFFRRNFEEMMHMDGSTTASVGS